MGRRTVAKGRRQAKRRMLARLIRWWKMPARKEFVQVSGGLDKRHLEAFGPRLMLHGGSGDAFLKPPVYV